jgi:WD40 repeat protein
MVFKKFKIFGHGILLQQGILMRSSLSSATKTQVLFSASADETIRLWNLENGKCTHVYEGFGEAILLLKMMPNGDQICLTKSGDHAIKIWLFYLKNDLKFLRFLRGHTQTVICVKFSHVGDIIVSGSSDQTIKIWNYADGSCAKTLHGHTSCVLCLEMMPVGETLLSGSRDFTIKLWCLLKGVCLKTLSESSNLNWVHFLLVISSEKILSSTNDEIKIWNVKSEKCLDTLDIKNDYGISNLVLISNNEFFCSARKTSIQIRDFKGKLVNELKGHTNFISRLLPLPNTGELVSGSWDRTIKIWDTRRGCCLKTLKGHTGWTSYLMI